MAQPSISLRRLLSGRKTKKLLQDFLEIAPGIALALEDIEGRTLIKVGEALSPEASATSLSLPLRVDAYQLGVLRAQGPGLSAPVAEPALRVLADALQQIMERASEGRSLAQETLERYREINLLYNIGETISASLDTDEIPHLVLEEAVRVIQADGGAVFLFDDLQTLILRSGFGEDILTHLVEMSKGCFLEALQDGQPRILTAAQLTDAITPVAFILCAPLKTRERILGFVVLGRLEERAIFTADDEKLLMALAGQAAIAVDNARLFADVKQQRDAIAEMKNYMDNIFASIASGVITTDIEDMVTILNRAAERILGVKAEDTVGILYTTALPALGISLEPLVNTVKSENRLVVGHEVNPTLPGRGKVVLQLHLSPLKDNHENTTGIAIVVDDLTERRQLEEQMRQVRGTFERYVPPQVVEKLLSDPTSVRLGGVRQEVSILFADIRGFTSFSENCVPEVLIDVLNRHLDRAAEAVLSEEGTLDKFVGDAVMAIFNAPLSQPDHSLRAVRAALKIRNWVRELHHELPPDYRLSFGVSIVTGSAVVGNIGSTRLQNYTAVGDSVNLASRFQDQAGPGKIFINDLAYERLRDEVVVQELGYIHVKGHSEPDLLFEVTGLRSGEL